MIIDLRKKLRGMEQLIPFLPVLHTSLNMKHTFLYGLFVASHKNFKIRDDNCVNYFDPDYEKRHLKDIVKQLIHISEDNLIKTFALKTCPVS